MSCPVTNLAPRKKAALQAFEKSPTKMDKIWLV